MIRFAEEKDIDKIMYFIDTYWRKGHILGNDKAFFKYEHLQDERVNYVISETSKGEINAILGYIPYGKSNRDIMTVMWKANHSVEPSLGIELLKYLKENADVRIMASPGSNKKLKGLYHYLGYKFGKMNQWYRLNKNKRNFKISKIENYMIPDVNGNVKFELYREWEKLYASFDWNAYKDSNPKPYKETWYIKKRYFEHPIYNYIAYGVLDDSFCAKLLMIFRKIDLNGASVLRLLDCIGDYSYLKNTGNMMDILLEKYDAEFVDCYETGIDPKIMEGAGFLRTSESDNIIPNYFAPFQQENIDIYFFSTDPDIVLFKADGDQDRPN